MPGYHDPFSKSTPFNRMHSDLELSSKKKRTQQSYLQAVRKLSALIEKRFSNIVAFRSAKVAYDGHVDR